MQEIIYLDNAATTKIDDEVLEIMMPYLKENYANEASSYSFAREAKKAVDIAREEVATSIGADFGQIYFTSGGCEGDSMAIIGLSLANPKGKHIITSKIEHDAVLNSVEHMSKYHNYKIDYVNVDADGQICIEDLKNKITKDTTLVSIMMSNNEVGTNQPIKEISKICKEKDVLFHTDAVQSFGKIDIDVKNLGVDLLTISGHKIHSPKGIGALYLKKDIRISPIIFGGSQERGKRGGTLNTPYIVGLGRACKKMNANMDKNNSYVKTLRNYMIDKLKKEIANIRINTNIDISVSNILNISIEGVKTEEMMVLLDKENICVSAGAACSAGSLKKSHVLEAMGLEQKYINCALRISFSIYNTKNEIDIFVDKLSKIVEKLRNF